MEMRQITNGSDFEAIVVVFWSLLPTKFSTCATMFYEDRIDEAYFVLLGLSAVTGAPQR